jgi:hypothetical protein
MTDTSKAAKLLFLTTADTEILAAARATELLPEGFPEVRCANPTTLEDPRAFFRETLPEAGAVMVRLLGGRQAWPEGFVDCSPSGERPSPTRSLRRFRPRHLAPSPRRSSTSGTAASGTRRTSSGSSSTPSASKGTVSSRP